MCVYDVCFVNKKWSSHSLFYQMTNCSDTFIFVFERDFSQTDSCSVAEICYVDFNVLLHRLCGENEKNTSESKQDRCKD